MRGRESIINAIPNRCRRVFHNGVLPWLSIVVLLHSVGCTRKASPPIEPAQIHSGVVEIAEFSINGKDLHQKNISLIDFEYYTIKGRYNRQVKKEESWEEIVLILVSNDASAKTPDGIQYSRLIGEKNQETIKNGIAVWNCGWNKQEGVEVQLRAPVGTYELRVCLQTKPKTVAEKKSSLIEPMKFLVPIYVTRVNVVEGIPLMRNSKKEQSSKPKQKPNSEGTIEIL